jgi:hypothetical protein
VNRRKSSSNTTFNGDVSKIRYYNTMLSNYLLQSIKIDEKKFVELYNQFMFFIVSAVAKIILFFSYGKKNVTTSIENINRATSNSRKEKKSTTHTHITFYKNTSNNMPCKVTTHSFIFSSIACFFLLLDLLKNRLLNDH